MSKYSGLFLSFLLIFVCLWININRFPQVWEMVNGAGAVEPGRDHPSSDDRVLETKSDSLHGDDPFYAHVSGEGESWPKPVVVSASYPLAEETDSEEESVYRQVSYSADQCSAEAVNEEDGNHSEDGSVEGSPAEESHDEGTDETEASRNVHVHSSYRAAEFSEDSSPLNSEFPSYEVHP